LIRFGGRSRESSVNWNMWIRQIHRWLSIAFTAGVVVNTVVIFGLGQAQPAFWVYLLALIPLALLLLTGLYLFVLPYALSWAGGRRAVGQE
jgi:quinol-cytochrome oxidoreductase complex cytochrome b subunit